MLRVEITESASCQERGAPVESCVQKAGGHGSRFMQKEKLLQLANYNQTAAPRVSSGSWGRSSTAYSNTRISSHLCSLCSFRRLYGLFSRSLTGVSSMVGPMVNHHPWGWNQCYLRLRAQCLQSQGVKNLGMGNPAGCRSWVGLGTYYWRESGLKEGGGGIRGVKIDFLTMSLWKKNVRKMMRVSSFGQTKYITQILFMPQASSQCLQV